MSTSFEETALYESERDTADFETTSETIARADMAVCAETADWTETAWVAAERAKNNYWNLYIKHPNTLLIFYFNSKTF